MLSEDDWNDWAQDCIIVPIYPGGGMHAGTSLRVATSWGTADCTRVVSVPAGNIGRVVAVCQRETLQAIRAGVRSFLCVNALLARTPRTGSVSSAWYPRWTHIYYRATPIQGQRKMHAVLSDDAWNSQRVSVTATRLTSRSKPSRVRWEVPLGGGPAIVSDLHLIPFADVVQRPPRPPRPTQLTDAEMMDMGHALEQLLGI